MVCNYPFDSSSKKFNSILFIRMLLYWTENKEMPEFLIQVASHHAALKLSESWTWIDDQVHDMMPMTMIKMMIKF